MILATPVVLCGGSGTRLWPLSRAGFPKQFLSLSGTKSLFQMALIRLSHLANQDIQVTPCLMVTGEEHRFLALEQLRETGLSLQAALLEPVGKNTAAALTLAALQAMSEGDDPVLVVTPADQMIGDVQSFTKTIQGAIEEASQGSIVILGIQPDRPETGFGYIQAPSQDLVKVVKRFVEKPDLQKAQTYLAGGEYFWNAGMFVLKASVWLAALEEYRPDIAQSTRLAWQSRSTEELAQQVVIRPDRLAFEKIPAESIDYAVMEQCPGSSFPLKMMVLDATWSDLGAWDAVWQTLDKDAHGNAHRGDVLVSDSQNTLVQATSRLVSVVGLQDVVVIETPDAVLVSHRSRSQEVRDIVGQLQRSEREEHLLHRKVHRPWGWYDSVDEGERFKVKRIQVKPGASLSLQRHQHRAEHWIVVKGEAEITCGEKVFTLQENQSTYIAQGEIHRLKNVGVIPLEIIEVQSGAYLGEDDIERLDDTYGRVNS